MNKTIYQTIYVLHIYPGLVSNIWKQMKPIRFPKGPRGKPTRKSSICTVQWMAAPAAPPPKPSSVCRRCVKWKKQKTRHSRGLTRKNYFQTFFFWLQVCLVAIFGKLLAGFFWIGRGKRYCIVYIYICKHTWFYMFFEAKILYQWYGFLRYFEYFVSVTPRSKRGSSEGQWRNLGWIDVSKGVTSYPPWLGHLIFLLEHHQLLQDLLGKT